MKFDVVKFDGGKAGSIELDDAIFAVSPRADILQRVVKWQLAKRRAGTHDTQNRSEVSRTKAKYGRQKGSGGARHGKRSANIFRGGGVAHGPHPRDHSHSLNKKVRQLGLKMALSAKAAEGRLIVVDAVALDEPKTAALKAILANLGLSNALVIGGAALDSNVKLAVRNIPNVDVLPSAGLNVYDILRRQTLVLSKDAVEAIGARFAPKVVEEAA